MLALRVRLLLICCLLCAGFARVQAEEEKKIAPIYPSEHPIIIDGKITDWEYAPSLGLTKFATRISIAEVGTVTSFWSRYDAQNLYVAFRVTDSSPALNLREDNDRWQGDQVELLLCTDPENHSKHGAFGEYDYQFFIGPDAQDKVNVFVNINAFKRGYNIPEAEAALKRWDDKRGYDVEVRIPWASLHRPDYFTPKPGVQIGWQIQIDFGPADGGLRKAGIEYVAKWYPFGIHFQHPNSWGLARFLAPNETLFDPEPDDGKLKPIGKGELTFTVPKPGKVSINVVRPDGTLVRRVVIGEQMDKGTHTAVWDGYDETGKPAPGGDYRFVGSVSNMGMRYIATLGNTSPQPYGGCALNEGGEYRHGVWTDVIMNPDGTFYLMNEGGEGQPNIQMIDPAQEFRVKWGGTTSQAGFEMCSAGARDDKYLYFIHKGKILSHMDIDTRKCVRFPNNAWNITVAPEGDAVNGLGAFKQKVYVPLSIANRVDIYDGAAGTKTGSLDYAGFNAPTDVTVTPDGTIYVVDQHAVRRFTPDGAYQDCPVQGLARGESIAVSGNGDMFVCDAGTHQVLVYDAQGKLRKAFGPVGGATVKGKGPLVYGIPNPIKRNYPNPPGGFFYLEYKEPITEWVGGPVYPDRFFKPLGIAVDAAGNLVVVDRGNARVQVFDPAGKLRKSIIAQFYTSACVDPKAPNTVYVNATESIMRQYKLDWTTGKQELTAQWAPLAWLTTYDGSYPTVRMNGAQPYFFSSRSPQTLTIEDGKPRMCYTADGRRLSFELSGDFQINDNWDILSCVRAKTTGDVTIIRYPFKGFDARRNPTYGEPQTVFELAKADPDWKSRLSGGKPQNPIVEGFEVAQDGSVYVVPVDRPEFVPRDCRLMMFSPQGKLMWSVCRGTRGFWDKPGIEMSFPDDIPAVIDDKVFVTDVTGTLHTFNNEGLYLGSLCEGGDWATELRGKDPRYQPQGEMFLSQVFRNPKDKRVYAILTPNAAPLALTYEVTGIDDVQTFNGTCTLTLFPPEAK